MSDLGVTEEQLQLSTQWNEEKTATEIATLLWIKATLYDIRMSYNSQELSADDIVKVQKHLHAHLSEIVEVRINPDFTFEISSNH